MATSAPLPGVGARIEARAAAKQILTITVRGEPYRLALNNLPLADRMLVRKATGIPYERFLGEVEPGGASQVGLDTIVLMWWLARRHAGEFQLTFDRAASEWPDDLEPDELSVEVGDVDPGATDPEA